MATAETIKTESVKTCRLGDRNGPSHSDVGPEPDVEQYFQIDGVSWTAYTTINDALVERSNPRMIFCTDRLILMSRSHIHEWLIDCLGYLVISIAAGLEIDCEPAGETTFRNKERGAGLEGDATFHFGDGAARIREIRSIELRDPPPPDLAVEVEVSHSVDQAAIVWAELGVPEVWRYDAHSKQCTFWKLGTDEEYSEIPESHVLPRVTPDDVAEQLVIAADVGVSRWVARLPDWTRNVLRPRQAGGG